MSSRKFRIYLSVLVGLLVLSLTPAAHVAGFVLALFVSPLLTPFGFLFGEAAPLVLGGILALFAGFLFYKALRKANDEDVEAARTRAAGGCTVMVVMIIAGAYFTFLVSPWPNG